jgi:hypothetical protein
VWRSLLLFALLGSGLFAADRLWWGVEPPAPVVIPAARVAAIEAELARVIGRPPSDAELARAIEPEIDDELLYREALARGYDQGDPVVYRRLVQNLRFAGAPDTRDDASLYREALALGMQHSDVVVRRRLVQRMRFDLEASGDAAPDDEALRAHYTRHADAYRSDARVRFTQLYFAPERGAAAAQRLAALRAEGVAPGADAAHPDPFLYPPAQPSQTEAELADRFGDAFAAGVFAAGPGAWAGPIRSAYGSHLVWVHEHEPGRALGFDEVRERVRHEVIALRRRAALDAHLAELRDGVPVRVEGRNGTRAQRAGRDR